ncbi:lyase [Seminavis robusta]|uniref:Lyase n=1 Tax=Seminavis robusta TaxID=568900 RepID=A0A9N8DV60_9STRA|nr:lyase [Seminavis robusta]|eukprot:Sro394_g133860.1 lyase (651) ;mRNA; f:40038-42089
MVFLFSWNVAGLSTVVHRIHASYSDGAKEGSGSSSKNQKKGLGGHCRVFAGYFERHASPEIVCLQEAKIPKSQLTNRSEPRGCANVEGYESFWSCRLDDPSKGMNGVVTYAKKGTVISADAFALGDPKLDNQGRCVLTDHGNFVVFNVYVPASGSHSVKDKMRFLQALQRAMKKQREVHNKAVILTGDLNISHGKLDVYWKDLVLHVNELLRQVQQHRQTSATAATTTTSNSRDDFPRWKRQLAEAWPLIVETMKTKEVVPSQTQNSKTGEKFDKFRLQVTMSNPTRIVPLGKHCNVKEYCLYGYCFDEMGFYIDPDTNAVIPTQQENSVALSILQELMFKIAKVEWSDETLKTIADSSDAGRMCCNPFRQWLSKLLEEDDMVDTFRHFYPSARGRFTCWDQYTNRRYENDGTRIDYVIVDRSLSAFLEKGGPLRTGETFVGNKNNPPIKKSDPDAAVAMMDPLTEEAALAAATARGQFRMAAFEGGGIAEATQRTLDTQFGPRHTGIVYTPPSFSDHVAVSLLLAGGSGDTASDGDPPSHWRCKGWGNLVLAGNDPATKKAQPHKVQKSIASFFGRQGGTGSNKSTVSSKPIIPKLPKKRPTIESFFQPKSETPQGKGTVGQARVATRTSKRQKKKGTVPSILSHFSKK